LLALLLLAYVSLAAKKSLLLPVSYKNPAACAVIKSAVADFIAAVGFPWVSAVVIVSAVSVLASLLLMFPTFLLSLLLLASLLMLASILLLAFLQ
jgi:hypothetical protein